VDELTLLRNFQSDTRGPSPAETASARARLLAAIDAPPSSAWVVASWRLREAARRLGRPRFWAPAAAAAAVIAVAVAAAVIAVPGAGVPPSSGRQLYGPALLRQAAAAASRQAPGHGGYYAMVTEVEPAISSRHQVMLQYSWMGPHGAVLRDGKGILLEVQVGARVLTWAQIERLPTSPGPLLAYLARACTGLGSPLAPAEFGAVGSLLFAAPNLPALRAALLEVAARLPGLTAVRHAHDLIGRPATEVYIPDKSPNQPTSYLFVDPATGTLLGSADLYRMPLSCPPNVQVAVLASGYVKSAGDLPPGAPAKPRPVSPAALRCSGPPTPHPPT
jgi:hypothetical protein